MTDKPEKPSPHSKHGPETSLGVSRNIIRANFRGVGTNDVKSLLEAAAMNNTSGSVTSRGQVLGRSKDTFTKKKEAVVMKTTRRDKTIEDASSLDLPPKKDPTKELTRLSHAEYHNPVPRKMPKITMHEKD